MARFITALLITSLFSLVCAEEPMFRLGVNASFEDGNMRIQQVAPEGAGSRLHNSEVPAARLEPGDVIEEVDGKPIASMDDLVNAMNSSEDGYLLLKIRDINSGNSSLWNTAATPTARNPYEQMRDTIRRAVRTKQLSFTPFVLSNLENNNQFAMSNLNSVLRPIVPGEENTNADEKFRRCLIGVTAVRQHEIDMGRNAVISEETLEQCDDILSETHSRLAETNFEEQKMEIIDSDIDEIYDVIKDRLIQWAEDNNLKYIEEATMPLLITFRVRTSIPEATVQVLLASEKVIRLSKQGLAVRPVDPAGRQFLDTSVNWTPLPPQNAQAYGRYYYRLVFLQNGQLQPTPFDENRVIVINQMAPSGEIFFQ
jgi:hypothetical protein